jgi:hypothetical protein
MKMSYAEVCESCNGIFPASVFVVPFFQPVKVVVAQIQLNLFILPTVEEKDA